MTYKDESYDPFADRSQYRNWRGNWKARPKPHLSPMTVNGVPHWRCVMQVRGQYAGCGYQRIAPTASEAYEQCVAGEALSRPKPTRLPPEVRLK